MLTALLSFATIAALASGVDAGAAAAPGNGADTGQQMTSTKSPALIASAATASTTRTFGAGPLNDVLAWADQKKACGLTRDQLAAMMLAPTYPETGAYGPNAPGPMTLSRWDNQAALYAYGDPNSSFAKAFWHPGIGMWQFDSAGGWKLTGADAISSTTSAQTAATLMAQRWCTNPTRAYAWAPWNECVTTSVCEDIYNQIFDGTQLTNLVADSTVTSDGGMERHSCTSLTFGPVACAYVDPLKAQGYKAWANTSFGLSPVSAPFYVFAIGPTEYRTWLADDTGYPVTIVASKPITANARAGLNWQARDDLCDLTTMHGACDRSPFGRIDAAGGGAASAYVRGWVIDPDTTGPATVHVYVDDVFAGAITADKARPDVGATFPLFGSAHGYEAEMPNVGPGHHHVCTYGINVGEGTNATLGCQEFDEPAGNPTGSLDEAWGGAGHLFVRGWGIDPDSFDPLTLHVYVDDTRVAVLTTSTVRPDVAAVWPAFGFNRGYEATIDGVPSGVHRICVYGLNIGIGLNTTFGCRMVSILGGSPIGHLDEATPGFTNVTVRGWVIDPDTTAPTNVHVYVDGKFAGVALADQVRGDLTSPYPAYGAAHGFSFAVAPVGGGTHQVCAYGIDIAPPGNNALLNCIFVQSSGDPGGAFDDSSTAPGRVEVRGWAIDPDTTSPILVQVTIDGTVTESAVAGSRRDDVGAAFPAYGSSHGYDFSTDGLGGGAHQVCVAALDDASAQPKILLCRVVLGTGEPFGNLDEVIVNPGTATVRGWAIDPDTTEPITVHVYVDGVFSSAIPADQSRGDVGAAFPYYGAQHGYEVTIGALPPGPHTFCAYGINTGIGASNTTLGCATT